jgi:LSD1 subclass zinc finger protein
MTELEAIGIALSGFGAWLLARERDLSDPGLYHSRTALAWLGRLGLLLWLGGYVLIAFGAAWPWWGRLIEIGLLQIFGNGIIASIFDSLWSAISRRRSGQNDARSPGTDAGDRSTGRVDAGTQADVVDAELLASCPSCAQTLRIPSGRRGQVRCPKCQTVFLT